MITGRCVGQDLKKIARDFKVSELALVDPADLGPMARKRDLIQNANTSLDNIAELVLKKKLRKDPLVRLSKWSSPRLAKDQEQYAALDVTVALDAYFALLAKPDLTIRLDTSAATPDVAVDIVPSSGSVASMATRAAIGKIAALQSNWRILLAGCTPGVLKLTPSRRLATISRVTAPGLVIPGLKRMKNGKFVPVCLGDLGDAPFDVVLPIKMLKPHVDSDDIRPTDTPRATVAAATAPATVPATTAVPFGASLIGKRFCVFSHNSQPRLDVGYTPT